MLKRLLSFVLVFSLLMALLCSFAFADDYASSHYTVADVWASSANKGVSDVLGNISDYAPLANSLSGLAGAVFASIGGAEGYCELSDDTFHHSSTKQSYGCDSDEYGFYVLLRCDYCGKKFKCYSSDLQNAYNDYTASLPAQSIDQDGGLYWRPSSHGLFGVGYEGSNSNYLWCEHSKNGNSTLGGATAFFDCSSLSASLSVKPASSFFLTNRVRIRFDEYYPIDGFYSVVEGFSFSASGVDSSSNSGSVSFVDSLSSDALSFWFSSNSSYYRSTSDRFIGNRTFKFQRSSFSDSYGNYIYSGSSSLTTSRLVSFTCQIVSPLFKVVPSDTSLTSSGGTYNKNTRIGNINLNLGTTIKEGDTTTINNVYENTQIINEDNSTIYNPVTNTTYDIDNWDYDYSTRTYSGTLENGDTFIAAYLDDLIKLQLGDLELELHYVVEQDTPPVHTHTYKIISHTDPTCTANGSETYECDQCGERYVETLFALGHDYQLVETVDDSYMIDQETLVCPNCNSTNVTAVEGDGGTFLCTCGDCNESWSVAGQLVPGYSLYRCSRCGDEYKDYTGEGISNSDSTYWAWLQRWLINFKSWLGEKLDALTGSSGADIDITFDNDTYYENYEYNITYQNDQEDDNKFSVNKMVNKFRWVKDVWTIGKSLVSVVSADAANAYEFNISAIDSLGSDGDPVSDDEPELVVDGAGVMVNGAPQLTINLAAAQSPNGWNYGGEVVAFDLSWYTPYKSTVDGIVSGFLWAFFLIHLFRRTPDIIGGAGMTVSKAEDISTGKKGGRNE